MIEQETNTETVSPEIKPEGESLESAFSEFEKGTSTFTVPKEDSGTTKSISPTGTPESNALADQLKIKMFLGFACFMLAGFNMFIFNMLSKHKVEMSDMRLDEAEKEEVAIYLNSPEILELINKLPVWIIGVAHVEMMFYSKWEIGVERVKAEKKITEMEVVNEKK